MPAEQTVLVGENFEIRCENVEKFKTESAFAWLFEDELIPRATSSFLRVEKAAKSDAGKYNCLTKNTKNSTAIVSSSTHVYVFGMRFDLYMFKNIITKKKRLPNPPKKQYVWHRAKDIFLLVHEFILSKEIFSA